VEKWHGSGLAGHSKTLCFRYYFCSGSSYKLQIWHAACISPVPPYKSGKSRQGCGLGEHLKIVGFPDITCALSEGSNFEFDMLLGFISFNQKTNSDEKWE